MRLNGKCRSGGAQEPLEGDVEVVVHLTGVGILEAPRSLDDADITTLDNRARARDDRLERE